MKKIIPILLLAFVSLFAFSCDNNDDNNTAPYEDNDTIAVAYDINNASFTRINSGLYRYTNVFNTPLVQSDVVLIYMQTDTGTGGTPVWRLLPYTYFVGNAANDAVDYGFDFSKNDIAIYVSSSLNLDSSGNATYYTNKRFRVVIVPANTGKNSGVDYNDYNSVIKFYNINESKITVKN